MSRTDKRAVKIFDALSNLYRLQIVKSLLDSRSNVQSLASELKVTSETISNHLRILRNCELVESYRQGRQVFYELQRPEVIRKLLDILPDLHREEDPDI